MRSVVSSFEKASAWGAFALALGYVAAIALLS